MCRFEPPQAVGWIARTLEEAGFETWAVGGAVRDALAGRPSGDWDLATRATPPQIRKAFRRTVPIGIEHGTVGVLARDGTLYEVTTFRRDLETTGRHAVVSFADTIDEDLARRDFTINAVAWHPGSHELHDPFEGERDLKRRVLRTVGDPRERFREDYLRILRGLRFAGTFRLDIESETWRALTRAVDRMGVLSPERIREELEKVLSDATPPSRSLGLYAASGVTAFLYPELDRTIGWERSGGGGLRGDAFAHALRTVDLTDPSRTELRWAALFQGVGGPESPSGAGEEGKPFDERGLLRVAAILERLRSSNARIREVAAVVGWASCLPEAGASDADLRRWLSGAGRERLAAILRLRAAGLRADEATGAEMPASEFADLCRRLRASARSGDPLAVGELAITGRDLIAMGYPPGPHFGEVLEQLLERVLEDPSRNDREGLAREAREWLEARGGSGSGEEA